MAKHGLGIQFNDVGIASALKQFELRVPLNQRSYAWQDSHVRTLFEDFSAAISSDNPTYFLGTIVLTHGLDGKLEVADGQQRLATTAILIAVIRDYLYQKGGNEKQAAEKLVQQYLLDYKEISGEHVPKIALNFEDNDFFLSIFYYLQDIPTVRMMNQNLIHISAYNMHLLLLMIMFKK